MSVITCVPLPLPPSTDPFRYSNFGRQVIGFDPGNLTPSDFAEIQDLLHKVQVQTVQVQKPATGRFLIK